MRVLLCSTLLLLTVWRLAGAPPQQAGGRDAGHSFVGTDVVVQQDGTTAPKAQERVRNEKVSVTDTVLQPGETENVSGSLPSVTVYFQPGTLEVTPAGGKPGKLTVKRGETRSASAGPKAIKNTGSSELHYVRVNFLGAGESETWGKTGLAPHYKLLLEDRYTRTYDIRIPAQPTNRNIHIMTA